MVGVEREVARTIWETSRADESTISATGANIVARAVMPFLVQAWHEGRSSAQRGVKSCPYIEEKS